MENKCSDCKWFKPHKNDDRIGIGFCYCDNQDNCGLYRGDRIFDGDTDNTSDCKAFERKVYE